MRKSKNQVADTLERPSMYARNQKNLIQTVRIQLLLTMIAFAFISNHAYGQVRLVADLNPGKKDPVETKQFTFHESDGGRAFFVGQANELWTSDGTTEGTKFLILFVEIREIEVNGNTCFFSATTADAGNELWRSDGTAAGTRRVKDVYPGVGSSSPMYLTAVNGILYFSANSGGYNRELWRSDGTSSGTEMVKDIVPGNEGGKPSDLVAAGGKLFFVATSSSEGYELWMSDGTSAGTTLVKDINPGTAGSSIQNMVGAGSEVYFSAQSPFRGRQLWKSDGTAEGTSIVKVVNPTGSASVTDLINVNGLIFFLATDGSGVNELYRSDGTAGGTFVLTDIGKSLTSLSAVGDRLYFVENNTVNGIASQNIWKSDGTPSGTVNVTSQGGAQLTLPPSQHFYSINDNAYFFADDSNYRTYLWRVEETGNIQSVREIPWSETSIELVEINDLSHFLSDGYYWRSDGTSHGTYRLRTLCCGVGSRPLYLEEAGSTLHFSTTNPEAFWQTQGSVESTSVIENDFVEEIEGLDNDVFYRLGDSFGPGSSVWKLDHETGTKTQMSSVATDPRYITATRNRVFFVANTASGSRKLWVSDGTPEGTRAIEVSPEPNFLHSLGNDVVFYRNSEMWFSDGTEAGTQAIRTIQSGPQFLGEFNGSLFFFASDGVHGIELWRTNGTAGGTVMVKDIRQNDTAPIDLYDLTSAVFSEEWVYFSGLDSDGVYAIWRTDGTAEGTTKLMDAQTGGAPLLGVAGSNVFYVRANGIHTELWVWDGTNAKKLRTIDQSYANIKAIDGDVIYFVTRPGSLHPQRYPDIWRSDGTSGGTYPIRFQGIPELLRTAAGIVYLAGRADKEGSELFVIEESENTSSAAATPSVVSVVPMEDIIRSYPSPFSESFTLNVSGKEQSTFSIDVISSSGTSVEQFNLPHNVDHEIGSSHWRDGMYLLRIRSEGRTFTRKVVKMSR